MAKSKSRTSKQVNTGTKKKAPNPTGKGGFADNPDNRSNGHWKKEDSISYQYNYLMRMNKTDFEKFGRKPGLTVAQRIAINRVKAAMKDDTWSLSETKEITDRTEGKAPQFIGLGDVDNVKKALVEFVSDGNSQSSDTD